METPPSPTIRSSWAFRVGSSGAVSRCIVGFAAVLAFAQKPPEPATYLKPHLPPWISLGGEYRSRVEGFKGLAYREGNDDFYALSRFRLNLTLKPHSLVTVFAQAHDSQAWGRDQRGFPPFAENSIDLRQAYVELGATESKTFGLRVGRQEFVFGDQRLVGNAGWPNGARSFDAVQATARGNGARLDAFASTVVVIRDGTFDKHPRGQQFPRPLRQLHPARSGPGYRAILLLEGGAGSH